MIASLAITLDEPLLGGVRERRDEPKADQKIVIRSKALPIPSGPLHTVPSSFVPHRSLPSGRFCLVTLRSRAQLFERWLALTRG